MSLEVSLTLEQSYSAFWQCLDPFLTPPNHILFPWRELLQPGLSPDPADQAGLRMGAGTGSMASLQPAPSPCSSASPVCFIRLPVFYWHGGGGLGVCGVIASQQQGLGLA